MGFHLQHLCNCGTCEFCRRSQESFCLKASMLSTRRKTQVNFPTSLLLIETCYWHIKGYSQNYDCIVLTEFSSRNVLILFADLYCIYSIFFIVQDSPGKFNSQLSKVQVYARKSSKVKKDLWYCSYCYTHWLYLDCNYFVLICSIHFFQITWSFQGNCTFACFHV